jgi:hypothetical protein
VTITLNEIRNAVIDYLNTSVTTSVSVPVPEVPNTTNPNEVFRYDLTATNAAAPTGMRLVNVVYHVSISPSSVARLVVPDPAYAVARDGNHSSDTQLVKNALVTDMYLFRTDNVLEVGDTDILPGLVGKALGLGTATITFEVYADIDQGFLFPTTTTDPDATRVFSVV